MNEILESDNSTSSVSQNSRISDAKSALQTAEQNILNASTYAAGIIELAREYGLIRVPVV